MSYTSLPVLSENYLEYILRYTSLIKTPSPISFLSNLLFVHCFVLQIWIPLVIHSSREAVMAFIHFCLPFIDQLSWHTLLTVLNSEIMQMEKALYLSHESESVSRSVMSDSATLQTVAHQAPLSMGFSRQEYWSGLSGPSPGDLPNPWIKSRSPALQADSLPCEPPGKLCPIEAIGLLQGKTHIHTHIQ